MQNTYTMHSFVGLLAPKITHTTFTMSLFKYFVTAQVRLDSFRQTTVQNFLDSGF